MNLFRSQNSNILGWLYRTRRFIKGVITKHSVNVYHHTCAYNDCQAYTYQEKMICWAIKYSYEYLIIILSKIVTVFCVQLSMFLVQLLTCFQFKQDHSKKRHEKHCVGQCKEWFFHGNRTHSSYSIFDSRFL